MSPREHCQRKTAVATGARGTSHGRTIQNLTVGTYIQCHSGATLSPGGEVGAGAHGTSSWRTIQNLQVGACLQCDSGTKSSRDGEVAAGRRENAEVGSLLGRTNKTSELRRIQYTRILGSTFEHRSIWLQLVKALRRHTDCYPRQKREDVSLLY